MQVYFYLLPIAAILLITVCAIGYIFNWWNVFGGFKKRIDKVMINTEISSDYHKVAVCISAATNRENILEVKEMAFRFHIKYEYSITTKKRDQVFAFNLYTALLAEISEKEKQLGL